MRHMQGHSVKSQMISTELLYVALAPAEFKWAVGSLAISLLSRRGGGSVLEQKNRQLYEAVVQTKLAAAESELEKQKLLLALKRCADQNRSQLPCTEYGSNCRLSHFLLHCSERRHRDVLGQRIATLELRLAQTAASAGGHGRQRSRSPGLYGDADDAEDDHSPERAGGSAAVGVGKRVRKRKILAEGQILLEEGEQVGLLPSILFLYCVNLLHAWVPPQLRAAPLAASR